MKINTLSFCYPKHHSPVFSNFSLQLQPGRIYGLLGPNGAGKSTLLYMMAGLLTPDKGSVTLGGVDVRKRKPVTMREIFLVPDEFELPNVTLRQYIKTKILLMDEPTNGLDIPGKRQFRTFITQGIGSDRIFMISTHQVKDIESVLNHVLLIDRSEVIRNEELQANIDLEAYFEEAMHGKEVHHD